jgi:hypothetical protein
VEFAQLQRPETRSDTINQFEASRKQQGKSLSVIKFLCVVNELRKHMFSVRFFSRIFILDEHENREQVEAVFTHSLAPFLKGELLGSFYAPHTEISNGRIDVKHLYY